MSIASKLWARMRGDFLTAADQYYREGKLAAAARFYARAGKRTEAAQACVRAGLYDQAIHFFTEAGRFVEAGDLELHHGDLKEALQLYERGSAHSKAADTALKLEQPVRAARNLERAQRYEEAARYFERAGEFRDALRSWDRVLSRLQVDSSNGHVARHQQQEIDLHRARLLEKAGELVDAAKLLRDLGLADRAAVLLERSGRLPEAAAAFLEADQPERARALVERTEEVDLATQARIYLRAGDAARAGRLFVELGEHAEAAEAFERAEDWGAAADAWLAAEEPMRAGHAFYRHGQLEDAARCYARAKDHQTAADTYAKVGDDRAAAACYLLLEEPLKAAQHFIRAGDRPAARQALQEISPSASGFEQATLLLVPLLLEERLYDGALHRLSLINNQASTSTFAVERLYWEGRIHDAKGELDRAREAYQKAASLRKDHRDLSARLISLQQRLQERADGAGEASGSNGAPWRSSSLATGAVLQDRYEVICEIGRGGMGSVYKALDRHLNEPVAIKCVIARTDDKLKSTERLHREVQICRRIAHPNVVRVHDLGRFEGGFFVVMELLEGRTLDDVIRSGERLSLALVKDLLSGILLGLREAHTLRVIHRDLKPANIAITHGGVKIMDFGIAQIEDHDVSLTQTGQVVGSPMYMSPEQIQGLPLDARSDLYSLGVLAFAAMVGHEPFTGKTATAISLKHLQEEPPSLVELRPDAGPLWQSFLQRLLAKQPDDRYPSADAVLTALAELPN